MSTPDPELDAMMDAFYGPAEGSTPSKPTIASTPAPAPAEVVPTPPAPVAPVSPPKKTTNLTVEEILNTPQSANTASKDKAPVALLERDKTPKAPNYKLRQMLLKIGVVAVVVIIALYALNALFASKSVGGLDFDTKSPTEGATAPATDRGATLLADAQNFKNTHGSFVGWAPADTFSATSRDAAIFSAWDGEACIYGGILPGSAPQVKVDPSKEACSQAQIVAVQDALTSSEKSEDQAAVDTASESLVNAADDAMFYANRNFVNGAPSFDGVPASTDGVEVVATNGATALLRTNLRPGVCLYGTVSPTSLDSYQDAC